MSLLTSMTGCRASLLGLHTTLSPKLAVCWAYKQTIRVKAANRVHLGLLARVNSCPQAKRAGLVTESNAQVVGRRGSRVGYRGTLYLGASLLQNRLALLGPPTFVGEGSPSKIDYRKKGTRILTSLLEDLVCFCVCLGFKSASSG